jgi:hypothetical protein
MTRVPLPEPLVTDEATFAAIEAVVQATHRALWGEDAAAKAARHYLITERQLDPAVLHEAQIGYISDRPRAMCRIIAEAGIPWEVARAAGLVSVRDSAVRGALVAAGLDAADATQQADWLRQQLGQHADWYDDRYKQALRGPDETIRYRAGHWITMPVWTRDEANRPRPYGMQLRSCHPADALEDPAGGRYRNPPSNRLQPTAAPLAGIVEDAALWQEPTRPVVVCEGSYDRLTLCGALRDAAGERPAVIALGNAQAFWPDAARPIRGPSLLDLPAPRHIVLWLDNDATGIANTLSVARGFLERGHKVTVVRQGTMTPLKDANAWWCADPDGVRQGYDTGLRTSAVEAGLAMLPAASTEEPGLFAEMALLDGAAELWSLFPAAPTALGLLEHTRLPPAALQRWGVGRAIA